MHVLFFVLGNHENLPTINISVFTHKLILFTILFYKNTIQMIRVHLNPMVNSLLNPLFVSEMFFKFMFLATFLYSDCTIDVPASNYT